MSRSVIIVLALTLLTGSAFSQSVVSIIKPTKNLPIPEAIRDKLSGFAAAEAFSSLPNQDVVVAYDTIQARPGTADFMDNRPHIAILSKNNVKMNLDLQELAGVGPVLFQSMAVLREQESNAIAVFALALGVDTSSTFFVFVGRETSEYKVTATLKGTQAQLRLRPNSQVEFWSGNGLEPCVWCPKHYTTTTLAWRKGKLSSLATSVSKREYRPEDFADRPLVAQR